MRIAQISDTHILAPTTELEAGASRADNLRRCIAHINDQTVDLVIHTGDSVQDGEPDQYAHLKDILDGLDAPYFMVPGNRDRHDALRTAFRHLPYLPAEGDFLHYVVEDYPIRLVALDSVVPGERKGVFCSVRLDWLDRTLAAEPERPTLLYMHHPPFDIEPHYVGGYRRQNEADSLSEVVSRHPQVVRLLCGHVHCSHRESWGGTVATTMPSVAVDLRKEVDPAIGDTPLYLLHAASEEGLETHMQVVSG